MNPNDGEKYFVFLHHGLQYALPVLYVLEIVETPPLLLFHGDLPGCLGNVSHRNYLLPVLDPTALGARSGGAPGPSPTFLMVRHDGAVFGLAMDRFVAVVSLEDLGVRPGEGSPSTGDNPFVEMVRAFRKNTLILLSAATIAALVKRNFDSQQLLTDGERAPAARARAQAEAERRIFLCARIDRVLFGIPVEHVLEVIEGYDVTPLFQVPPLIRGLLNLRGQVLACLDISSELGFPPRPLEERNQFVILQDTGAALALCVDKVTGIRRLAPERIQKAEAVLSGDMTRYASSVLEEEDGALFILEVPAVFAATPLQPYRRQDG